MFSDRDIRDYTNWYDPFTLAAGSYTLQIDGRVAAAGAFSFRLVDMDTATLLTPGTAQSGTLTPGTEVDFYAFEGRAGEIVFVAADGDPERDATNTNVNFQIVAPDGVTVLVTAESGAGSGGPAGEGVRLTLAASGTHYVRVYGVDGTAVGSYDLMIHGSLELFVDGFETGDDDNWTLALP